MACIICKIIILLHSSKLPHCWRQRPPVTEIKETLIVSINYMNPQLIFTVLSFSTLTAVGQTRGACNCPSNTITHNGKPDKIFKFPNGKSLALCGYSEIQNKQKVFSEFVIYNCGQSKAIAQWDATQTCTIQQKNDTLIVQEFYNIANGKDLSLKWKKFYTTKYYWQSSKLKDTSFYNNGLRKYSSIEIKKVLTQFENLKKIYNSENTLLVGQRLFWAYVSGNKKAGQYLEELAEKFGPFDGAVAEEFDDLIATYKHYKNK